MLRPPERPLRAFGGPRVWLPLLVTVLAYFTYFQGYWNPPSLFWDENYHIASAQKYLNGTFFMEPHPPLGKLLIALGERLVAPDVNMPDDQFVGSNYARELPPGFSFVGYRLFPALFGWLTAPLLFAIFRLISKDDVVAGLLTLPYVFDNALIVHFRGAMLEPVMSFFCLATLLVFLLLLRRRVGSKSALWLSALLGACLAAAVTTKVIALVMILLFAPLLRVHLRRGSIRGDFVRVVSPSLVGFFVVFVAVWQVHFGLASEVNPALPNEGHYQASEAYKRVLADHGTASLGNFDMMLRDSLAFLPHYARGVPRLDLCKSDENGSPWFFWPFGGRAINYRWESTGDQAEAYRYLYLQSNPTGWFLGLAGVVISTVMLLGSLLLPVSRPLEHRFLLTTMLGLYLAYMLAISRIDRVLYLYHYFLPLLLSWVLFGVVVVELRRLGRWFVDARRRRLVLVLCGAAVFATFLFYRPLTYYEPITDTAFARRSILRIWDLRCVRCDRTSPLVSKTCP